MNHRPEMSVYDDPWGEDIPIGDEERAVALKHIAESEAAWVKVFGPLPFVLLDNGTDKREAPEGAGLVTLILCAVMLAVMAFCWWVVTR